MKKSILPPLLQKRLVGHSEQLGEFIKSQSNERMHHAWLLSGPYSIGKATLALHCAKWLLQASGNTRAPIPLQYDAKDRGVIQVEALSHPDFMLLEGERDLLECGKKHPAIIVDEVRKATQFSHMTPVESPYRVVVIDSVDEMNYNAANAILKLLEEPPANMILFLISHVPGKVLPTIRSRCRTLRLFSLPLPEFSSIISEHAGSLSAEQLAILYDITGGAVRPVLEILELGISDAIIEMLNDTLKNNINKIQELISIAKKHQEYWRTVTEVLINIIRRQVRSNAVAGIDVNNDLALLSNLQAMLADVGRLHLDMEASMLAAIY